MRDRIISEDYIRAINHLEKENNDSVKSIQLANYLDVSKPTISEMLRKLKDQGLIDFDSYKPIKLTKKGMRKAEYLTFKHRIIEIFLKDILKLKKESIHEEAHRLEHAFSDESILKMKKMLKNPNFCPHGKPIPNIIIKK